jgi:hypothetical protein
VEAAIVGRPAGALAATNGRRHRASIARSPLGAAIRGRPHKPLTSTDAPPTFASVRVQIMKEIIGRSMGF